MSRNNASSGATPTGNGVITEVEMAQRLEEAELTAVSESDEQIKKLEEIREEYENLKGTLKRLPDELTHDVMVPFGKKAFMPGKLVHTNEILVLLGENWFVETSASRASEIADRRLARLDEMIRETKKQRDMFQNRSSFTKDVAGTLGTTEGEEEIREEYDADEFAAIKEKKRHRAAQAQTQSRDQLMAKARRAMFKCEQEEEEEQTLSSASAIKNNSSNNKSPSSKSKSSLKHKTTNAMPISEYDWQNRLKAETENQELEKISSKTTEKREVIDIVYDEDDEEYDDEDLTDDGDDEDNDDDDDEDVPIVPFGNLGKSRPPAEKDDEDDDDEEEDVPTVEFGNLGKPKSGIKTTPPNALRTVSLTGSDATDDDTPRTRERKRLTWDAGVEDNDAEKCDAFGSRLKALFNSYKDEEIIVSDEEDDEDDDKPAVDVETVKIFVKHTPADEIDNGGSDSEINDLSTNSPRHPGEIKPTGKVATNGSENKRSTRFGELPDTVVETNRAPNDSAVHSVVVTSGLTTPPSTPLTYQEPKSILKKNRRNVSAKFRIAEDEDNSSSCDDDVTRQPGKGRLILKKTVTAVAEEIKEKEPVPLSMVENMSISNPSDKTDGTNAQSDPPKRVSKFKQQRQNRY